MTDIRNPIPSNDGDWLKNFGELWNKQVNDLKSRFSSLIETSLMPGVDPTDVPIIIVKKDSIIEVLRFLRDDASTQYRFLSATVHVERHESTHRPLQDRNTFSDWQ